METRRVTHGFTLIEMLVVIAILVILTGAVLPKLDRIILKSNKAVAGSTAGEVSRYIQTYRIAHNYYPDHWDSLMGGADGTDATTLWTGPATGATAGKGPGLEPQTTGALPGSPHKLIVTQLGAQSATNHYLRSITRMGISTVETIGLSPGSDLPGNLYITDVSLGETTPLATVNVDGLGGGDPDALAIVNQIYKETTGIIPAGNMLIVFGFGPRNDAVGDVMQETPYYPNTDPNQYYNRYLVIFEAHADGSRAELKMVTGADGDRIDDEIGDYYQKL